ncbi:MAG TPA: PQQ-binding-like beta-propeller repeat protein [Actinocrinis sp.]
MSAQSDDDALQADVPRAGAARAAVAVTGLILAYCAALGMAVSLFRPWYAFGSLPHPEQEPGGRWVKLCIVLLLIALGLFALEWPRGSWAARGRMYRRIGTLALSGGLLVLVLLQTDGLARLWPVRPFGWLAVFSAAGLVAGWLLLALAPPWRTAGTQWWRAGLGASLRRRPVVVVGCVAVALVVVAAALTGVRAAAVMVQNTTASALPALAASAPRDPGRVLWHVQLGEDERVRAVSGRYVLVDQLDGVRVLDSATGRVLWYYVRRYDEYGLDDSVFSPDGRTVYAIFHARGGTDFAAPTQEAASYTVVALDTATGAVRWQWTTRDTVSSDDWDDQPVPSPWQQGSSWLAVGDELVHVSQSTESDFATGWAAAAGWVARTGAPAWSVLLPGSSLGGPQCSIYPFEGNAAAIAAGVLAVVEFCGPGDQTVARLLGLSLSTGRQIWSASLAADSNPVVGAVAGVGFLVGNTIGQYTYANTATLLAAPTGRELGSFTEPDGPLDDGYDGRVQGGDPALSLLPGAGTLGITAFAPSTWAKTWTATVAAPTKDTLGPFQAATCSGMSYVSVYDGTRVRLVAHANTARTGTTASYDEPDIVGAPTMLACASGAVLLEASDDGAVFPASGALYALG